MDVLRSSVQRWTRSGHACNNSRSAVAALPPPAHRPSNPVPPRTYYPSLPPLHAIHYLPSITYYPSLLYFSQFEALLTSLTGLTFAGRVSHRLTSAALLPMPTPSSDIPHGPHTLTRTCQHLGSSEFGLQTFAPAHEPMPFAQNQQLQAIATLTTRSLRENSDFREQEGTPLSVPDASLAPPVL